MIEIFIKILVVFRFRNARFSDPYMKIDVNSICVKIQWKKWQKIRDLLEKIWGINFDFSSLKLIAKIHKFKPIPPITMYWKYLEICALLST